MTNVVISVNTDTQDLPKGTSAIEWTDIEPLDDSIIFTRGDNIVKDGAQIPSASALTQAGIILNSTEQIVSNYLLSDVSANTLKTIFGMGNLDNKHVIAFDFDGITASEPVLEAWDDASMTTINTTVLGQGSAISSWLRGVVTTDISPGTNWLGVRLAGAADGNFLWLNNGNGALSAPKILYCNLKLVIPALQLDGIADTPIIVVKYATN